MKKVKIGDITLKKALTICAEHEQSKTCEGCLLYLNEPDKPYGCVFDTFGKDVDLVTNIEVDMAKEEEKKNDQN